MEYSGVAHVARDDVRAARQMAKTTSRRCFKVASFSLDDESSICWLHPIMRCFDLGNIVVRTFHKLRHQIQQDSAFFRAERGEGDFQELQIDFVAVIEHLLAARGQVVMQGAAFATLSLHKTKPYKSGRQGAERLIRVEGELC